MKLRKGKITKLYLDIIFLAQQLNKSEWEQEIETNNGNLKVKIAITQ